MCHNDRKYRVIQRIMLVCSFLMLLSVIVPHHHHADGLPCYRILTEGTADPDDPDMNHHASHECGCDGHNIAVFTSVVSHITDGNEIQHLFVLQTLFDHIYSYQYHFIGKFFSVLADRIIESLYSSGFVSVNLLRAPPFFVN